MKNSHNFISVAFVATLGLAACDRNEAPDAPSTSAASATAETVMQPDNSSPALKKSTFAPRKPAVKVIWI